MGKPPERDVSRIIEYIRDCVEHPENHPEHWEDWLRAGRRRFLLLNIIYYIQHVQGKEEGVTKEDLERFMRELYYVNREMFSNIIKPWKSLDDTLKELLEQRLIVQVSEGAYLVNKERIRDEKDLIYWGGIKGTLDKVSMEISKL
ncbi:hypothetical protein EP1X_00605 [Thermococcus sp. EP1]|uniref:hypothetical protein n=1 Tax=Thermococcus sp. EP1 TaxID=1591054 RepID=UPI0006DBC887|nr:hypothetical protein [Thermococcus sp. EP1]KPU63739.1 hypothetical protein EP1X_00605 [Thermococcus sp. EP1]